MIGNKGSSIITTPIIITIGALMISMLIILSVNIITPFIWYEKLSSVCMQYIYVMEEYGYLTSKEATLLKEDLRKEGFNLSLVDLKYTNNKTNYGDPIFLTVSYQYAIKIPFREAEFIPMTVKRNSVSKR